MLGIFKRDREKGANLVEFALLAPLLVLLLLGIVEFGWKFSQFNDLRHAVREGARFAAVDGGDNGAIEDRVCNGLDLVGAGITEVRMSWTTDADSDSNSDIGEPGAIRVEIDVSSLSNAPLISSFLPAQLASDIEFRLEQPPSQWSTRTLSAVSC